MDNLIFEKTWIDSNLVEDLFQIKVIANNDGITMSSEVYAQTCHLNSFQNGVKNIHISPFSTVMGNNDDNNLDFVKFKFVSDKRGIVFVSIYMKARANENENNTANFSISTDIASLDRFSLELKKIAEGKIGERAQLHY